MEVEVTIDDPKIYTRPFTIRFTELLLTDTDILEYFCSENEKDVEHMSRSNGYRSPAHVMLSRVYRCHQETYGEQATTEQHMRALSAHIGEKVSRGELRGLFPFCPD
jgi:hypothetical protein